MTSVRLPPKLLNENLPYTISARVRDKAGNQWKLPDTDAILVNYFLAWPTANIRTPTDSSEVSCIVRITGSVDAIALTGFEWLISFVPGVEEPCSEEPCSADNIIATGNTPVHEGLLALWDAQALPKGDYTLCLTVSNNQGAVSVRRNITVVNCTVQYGDVSGDGMVTAYDASLVMQAVVGSHSLSDTQHKAAEVSGDGKVTTYDVAQILQYATGLIDRFSTGVTFQYNNMCGLFV